MPVVSVWSRPNGLPIAKTFCPTFRSRLVPTRIGGSFASGAPIRRTARSLSGSTPTTCAFQSDWSASVTTSESASWMTWKFVTMWPCRSQTKPEPGALRDLRHLEEAHGPAREARDVDDGRAAALEELDRGLLVGGEVAARRDGPSLGRSALQAGGRRRARRRNSAAGREDEPARRRARGGPAGRSGRPAAAGAAERSRTREAGGSTRGRVRARQGWTRTDSMTTGVTGAFTNAPPWFDVGVVLILSTTSMPSVTLPKTQ